MKKFITFLTFMIIATMSCIGCGNSAGNAPEQSTEMEEAAAGNITSSMKTSLNLEFPKMKKFQIDSADSYDEYGLFNYKEKADIITSYEDQICLQKSYGFTKEMYENLNPDELVPGVSELSFFEYSVEETNALVVLHLKYKNLEDPKNCTQLHEKGIMTFKDPSTKDRCFEASSTFKTFAEAGYPEVNAILLPPAR